MTLPELLSAVCNHDDCPEWIQNAVIDGFNELNSKINLTPNYFRYVLEVCGEPKTCEVCNKSIFEGERVLHEPCRKFLSENAKTAKKEGAK